MIAPRPGPPEELQRIRRELGRKRRAPLRILIADDPSRPVRALVLPRILPLLAVALTAALAVVAAGATAAWLRLDTAVDVLEGRVSSMVQAAEDVARNPLPGGERGGVALAALAGEGRLRVRPPAGDKARFQVESVNTGEKVEVTLDLASGEVEPESYRRLRHLMRCLRTGAETPVDPRLVELLYRLAQRTRQKILLVSGFRAPMFSTADISYHTRGMAADVRVPGLTPLMLRDLLASMGVKGLGYYPTSQFVHVDVREDRYHWTDFGKDKGDDEGTEHGPNPAVAGP